jgi:hypothetical protein
MGKRHTFGKMSIEIYDQNDKLIKEVPAGKSAGINVVEMTATLEKPKSAPSENPQALFGTLNGPNLPAGTYKVKVIKGKEEFLTSFSLTYPENSPYTAEDRKLQQETTMKLYAQTEQIAYLYAAQDGIAKQAKQAVEKNPKLAKVINPFVKEVEDQNASLVFRGGDFYINTEEKLAEQVSSLYGEVSAYPGKPGTAQVERVGGLDQEVKSATVKFEQIKGEKLKKINTVISSDKIFKPIQVLTPDEFKKGEGSGSINPKKFDFTGFKLLR